MKIGVIQASSQCEKNKILFDTVSKYAKDHTVVNFGCFATEETQYSYIEISIEIGLLLSSGAVDFIVTGCSSGQGMMLACNNMPGVLCGYTPTPQDAYLFAQINDGNAVSLPLGLNYGWAGEINLNHTLEALFLEPFGNGYPKHEAERKMKDTAKLKEIRKLSQIGMRELLEKLDAGILQKVLERRNVTDFIIENGSNGELVEWVRAKCDTGVAVISEEQMKEAQMTSQTIAYYNQNTQSFIDRTIHTDMSFSQNKFISLLSPGMKILDAGCGSGRDSKFFMEKGFAVQAMDASQKMCQMAQEYIGQPVVCTTFESMSWEEEFDAIWACACLLHVQKDALAQILRRFHKALKEDGVFYASFKFGDKEEERLGRHFSDYQLDEIEQVFLKDGLFELIESYETEDARPDYKDKPWVNIIVRKKKE